MVHKPESAGWNHLYLLLTLGLLIFISSCGVQNNYHKLPPKRYPLFIDDLPKESLLAALSHHQHYLDSFPDSTILGTPDQTITYGDLRQSLAAFRKIIEDNPQPYDLDELIKNNFTVYKSSGRKKKTPGKILLTGYYEPVFEGSLTPTDIFVYPLYGVPESLASVKDTNSGKTTVGRFDKDGMLLPFWSRKEIETTGVLRGKELVFLRDPLDAYLLHVQGSGRIKLPDGSIRSIGYSASNGHEYKSLGKLFVDKGLLPIEDVSIPAIRNYFTKHPADIPAMLFHNPRYIFFSWRDNTGPRGSLGVPLTPGRSVAVDQSVFPAGAIGYLVSQKPVLGEDGTILYWKTFSRFVLPQDSGSAIKGAGRVDLFCGNGLYAETAASHMNEEGTFFLLVQNSFELPKKIK